MPRSKNSYSITLKDRTLTILPPKELAYDLVPRIKAEVETAMEQPDLGEVVVDLSRTTFMDSSGISVLILIQKMASQSGITVRLDRPCPEISKILHLVGLAEFFHIPGQS